MKRTINLYLGMPDIDLKKWDLADTPLEISIVGPQKSWGTIGGDAQYAIKDALLDDDWFTDIQPLD